MASSITAISLVNPTLASDRAPAHSAGARGLSQTQNANSATQQSGRSVAQHDDALSQLLDKYAHDQSHGVAASSLSDLRRHILTTAKTLGRDVTLPGASARHEATTPADASSQAHRLDRTV